jgi:hypothetical protein
VLAVLTDMCLSFSITTESSAELTSNLAVITGVLLMSALLMVVVDLFLLVEGECVSLILEVDSEPCLLLKELLAATMAAAASLKLSVEGKHTTTQF